MLNFRTCTWVFISLLVTGIALSFVFHFSIAWVLVLPAIYLLLLVYGSVNICSGFYLRSVCRGDHEKKEISITFDDGPDAKITPVLLDILGRKNVKACFFLKGKNIEKNESIVKRIVDEGHMVGNHSYSHSYFYDFFSASRMEREIGRTEKLIENITGKRTKFFRPPYGVTNPAVMRSVKRTNYDTIGWSIKSKDTTVKNTLRITDRVLKNIKPGGIILFHDTEPVNISALPEIIDGLRTKGYEISRLDIMTGLPGYH